MSLYIAQERKRSTIDGAGIQYIPGHVDKFVDLIIGKYLSNDNSDVLELGGGGLRFAIPALLHGRKITVVDLDIQALDIREIVDRVNKNNKIRIDIENVLPFIQVKQQDIFSFLETTECQYGLVALFRVIHIFNPQMIDKLFTLISSKISVGGYLVVSAISPYDFSKNTAFNEIYLNTKSLLPDSGLFREFENNIKADEIRSVQNLSPRVHFINMDYMQQKAQDYGYEIIEHEVPSTRIVAGYVLRKTD